MKAAPVLSLQIFPYQQIYAPYNHKYNKGRKEAEQPIGDICKFHISRICYLLSDFNGKGDYDYYGKHVKKRNCHNVTRIAEPFEYGMYQEHQKNSENPHNDKMKFLIGENILTAVVYCKDGIMYPRY